MVDTSLVLGVPDGLVAPSRGVFFEFLYFFRRNKAAAASFPLKNDIALFAASQIVTVVKLPHNDISTWARVGCGP